MSAKIINLPVRREVRAPVASPVGRDEIGASVHAEGVRVLLTVGSVEKWLSPRETLEICSKLMAGAISALEIEHGNNA